MDTNPNSWFACENGHPVLEGSTICIKCGAQVTTRRVEPPRAAASTASTPASQSTSRPPMSAEAGRRVSLLVGISVAVAVAAAGVFLCVAASQDVDPGSEITSEYPVSPPCEEIGVTELELGAAYIDAPAVSCFTVTDNVFVTIGVRGSEGSDLSVEVKSSDGVTWEASEHTYGSEPVVSSVFFPGSYVVTVGDRHAPEPEEFTLYSVIRDPSVPWGDVDTVLPFLAECGTASVPILDNAPMLPLPNAPRYSCVVVASGGFAKFGAIADDGNSANLNLAVHSFDDSGRPQFIRSVDDTFGTDPEMSLDLEAGTYLLELTEATGAPLGDFSVYIDTMDVNTTEMYFRRGNVSLPLESLAATDCADGRLPALALDGSLSLRGGKALACVTLEQQTRVVAKAISTSGQDLTLEVVGFDEGGVPVRYGWVDDDLWATDFENYDPRLDILLPSGTYVLAVAVFSGGVVGDAVITIDEVSD